MKILTALTYYRPHTSGLTIYAERLAGVRFVVRALPPITITADRRDPVALLAQTAALDAQLEPILRRFAEQWYMATAFVP